MRRIRWKIKRFWKNKKDVIQSTCRTIITICTIVTAILSVFIAKKALDVSEIALKASSTAIEPILDIDIDWYNDKIEVTNETDDIFQIKDVTFGSVRTIAVFPDNLDEISSVEIQENCTGFNLEHGHTLGTDCSDEDAKKYNKKFRLDFDTEYADRSTNRLDLLEKSVQEECDSNSYIYWGVSPNYHYRYIIIEYEDVYGNRRCQYYIYKCEYTTTWRLYKLTEEQFERYTESIIYEYDEEEIIKKLFSSENLKDFDKTKYRSFAEWNNWEQFDEK